ncbi:hypothetical protein CIK70_12265 [Brachybacterium alimentarium]|nr:hypothetical protein CIK70_12265 [Brachybacterium alimentarium]
MLLRRYDTTEGPLEEPLTLAHLTGDDRVLTTAIATALRDEVTLDDGTLPLGIRFLSKHGHPARGTGICWAYWMRYVDRGLDEPATITHQTGIRDDDADLIAVQAYCKIKSR